MSVSDQSAEAVSDCPISIVDIVASIEAGQFEIADSYIRHLSVADSDSQQRLRDAIPGLLAQVRESRRALAANLRRQGTTRVAKQAYRS